MRHDLQDLFRLLTKGSRKYADDDREFGPIYNGLARPIHLLLIRRMPVSAQVWWRYRSSTRKTRKWDMPDLILDHIAMILAVVSVSAFCFRNRDPHRRAN